MELPEDELTFLRDLVKTSRQKIVRVQWIDRDGTTRVTPLSQTENTRLKQIAARLGTNPGEILRQAAHIPVPKYTGKKSPSSEDNGDPAN
ncbi:hypothetical protein CMV30_02660 [Nibricoccus aquaticus]|uniref:Uncharacterized protein n=1 Tax=Nibricoccus aquaticus TaxID=2576891 RepID=A0A290QF23_9BACT|nr:hypothetical protein [Nibricoccus aquaticus]ATC62951.1 hypothetical protein CMV30_02660 [Nibricoccus aquaticus]